MKKLIAISCLITCVVSYAADTTYNSIFVDGSGNSSVPFSGTSVLPGTMPIGQMVPSVATAFTNILNAITNLQNQVAALQAISNPTNFSAIQTDCISGQRYTNTSGGSIIVNQGFNLTFAGVTGNTKVSLIVPGSSTNTIGKATTFAVTLGETIQLQLGITVTNGQSWFFTNTVSGNGNSVSVATNSGQLTYMRAQ